jgi:hypothetical protein
MYMHCSENNHIHTQVVVGIIVHVRGLQWSQSCMYAGCSGHNLIDMSVVEGTIAYIHTWFLGRSKFVQGGASSSTR